MCFLKASLHCLNVHLVNNRILKANTSEYPLERFNI